MRIGAVLFLALSPAFAQQAMNDAQLQAATRDFQREANALWRAKQWLPMVQRVEAFDAHPDVRRVSELHHSNLFLMAAGYCKLRDTAKTLAALRQLASAGYRDAKRLEGEPCFAAVIPQKEFLPILERVRASAAFWNDTAFRSAYREDLTADEKVAGLSKFWSEAKFNFAWFEKLPPDFDWDALYLAYLPKVRETRSTAAYYRVLQQFAALLRDGHTAVSPPREVTGLYYSRPPLTLRYVEGHVLVYPEDGRLREQGIVPGIELVAVDGVPVRQYAEERIFPYEHASSPQELEVQAFEMRLLCGAAGSTVRLTFRSPEGATFERTLTRGRMGSPRRPEFEFKLLAGNVGYIAINTFATDTAMAQFERRFDEIAKADKLIFDVRENGGGNSGYGTRILSHLISEPRAVTAWRTREYRPAYRAWGRAEGWSGGAPILEPSATQHYTGPVAVLVSRRTFSAAEDFAADFQVMQRGPIVGEPTGGSTGQPLMFALPGGGSGRVCTRQVFYPDGRQFVGPGIQPDVSVPSTLADFRAGRDAVLERALAHLSH